MDRFHFFQGGFLSNPFMIGYALRFYWIAARGYRLRPWRSPYLRWRLETFSGIPADQVTPEVFWGFLWRERRGVWRFLKWGAAMQRLEKQRRREAEPSGPAVPPVPQARAHSR